MGNTQKFLRACYATLYEAGLASDSYLPSIEPAVSKWEDVFFMKGLKEELFTVDSEGYVQSSFLPAPAKKETKQKMTQLFWHHAGGRRGLFREGICQLAMAVRLVEEYGWPPDRIKMEAKASATGAPAYGIDILVESSDGGPMICCEVKRDGRTHESLLHAFESCCAAGLHDRASCAYPNDHPKFAVCAAVKARYFVAVSPDKFDVFSLTHVGGKMVPARAARLPSRRQLEMD